MTDLSKTSGSSPPRLTLVPPDKLVLTKAEILAALVPIQNLAARIKETHGLFEEYHFALPGDHEDYSDAAGYIPEEDQISFPDCDLDLYDMIDGMRGRFGVERTDALQVLWSTLYDAMAETVRERDCAEDRERRAKAAEKAAATRAKKAKAKRESEREKDQRIAELEAQLAKKPRLTIVRPEPDDDGDGEAA